MSCCVCLHVYADVELENGEGRVGLVVEGTAGASGAPPDVSPAA